MNLRPPAALLAFALATCIAAAAAQEHSLPDIGSSAANVLSPAKQAEYGAMVLAQLRHEGYVLDDPLLDAWLNDAGQRLAAASNKPQQPFTFFLLRERQINAFATLGGYVAVNAGLVLAADREDEVAGVLAHEISHVTQQHVLRGAEKAQRESLPILLATLGAIVEVRGRLAVVQSHVPPQAHVDYSDPVYRVSLLDSEPVDYACCIRMRESDLAAHPQEARA